MAKDDVEFTFSTAGFASAIGKVALIGAAIFGAFKAASAAIRNFVPEIGSTFSIAGKVIGRNLLMPLRRFLLPILQKLLTWVQKNRAMFVRFGQVIVNVFKFIGQVFKTLFRLFDPIIRRIKELLKSIFGDTASSVTKTINLVIFKLTTLVIALETLLKPLFEGLGDLFGAVIRTVKRFGESFVKAFSGMFDPLEEGNGLMKDLAGLLDDISGALDTLAPAFKILGTILGTYLGTALKATILQLKIVFTLLGALFKTITDPKEFSNIAKRAFDKISGDIKTFGKGTAAGFGKAFEDIKTTVAGGSPEKVEDAIITKDGKVIKTSPDDNIIATKGGMGKKIEVNLNAAGMILNVTEGNAENAGMNLMSGIGKKLRDEIQTEIVLEGIN